MFRLFKFLPPFDFINMAPKTFLNILCDNKKIKTFLTVLELVGRIG